MNYKGISAGELATRLDVQRSNISHVLNGRNKPGASFIEKFLTEFPDLNARWFLIGTGEMVNSPKKEVLDWLKEDHKKEKAVHSKADTAADEDVASLKDEDPPQYQTRKITGQAKKVEKIVIFYTDKTFSAYHAE